MKVKLGCWPAVLVAPVVLLAPAVLGRKSIQGTATCLPLVLEEELELIELLLELWSWELELPEGLVLLPELLPEGLVAPPELPLEELSERMAKSIRPEAGLTMTSLMVPKVSPEELLTSAPLS
jgi:hypothetical protein